MSLPSTVAETSLWRCCWTIEKKSSPLKAKSTVLFVWCKSLFTVASLVRSLSFSAMQFSLWTRILVHKNERFLKSQSLLMPSVMRWDWNCKELNGTEWWLPDRARIISLMVWRNTENRQVSSVNQHTHLHLLSWWHVAGQIGPPGGVSGPLYCSFNVFSCEKRTREHRHIPCFDVHLFLLRPLLRTHTWKLASQEPNVKTVTCSRNIFFQLHLINCSYNSRPMIQNIIP